jgi:hypothetical protein
MVTPTSIVRIESPGKQQEVERALLALGAEVPDPEGDQYERLSRHACEELPLDKGRLLASRQWYLGYSQLLQHIGQQVPLAQLTSLPEDILLMFDKRACHALLERNQISVPAALEPIHSYNELTSHMQRLNWNRVFIKLAHGSSASGIVAYRFSRDQHQAITTVEVVNDGDSYRLYNSRRIRIYWDQQEIATLINTLCRQRVHVELWIPKASYGRQVFDLRVLVVAGQARHTVVRMSNSPMTNLHLLNKRGDTEAVLAAIGTEHWDEARQTCECASQLFRSLHTGVDLLFSSSFRYHALVEMNAFGDLLPGILHNGQDTYTAEILAALNQRDR